MNPSVTEVWGPYCANTRPTPKSRKAGDRSRVSPAVEPLNMAVRSGAGIARPPLRSDPCPLTSDP